MNRNYLMICADSRRALSRSPQPSLACWTTKATGRLQWTCKSRAHLTSHISLFSSHISHLTSHNSHLTSHISHLSFHIYIYLYIYMYIFATFVCDSVAARLVDPAFTVALNNWLGAIGPDRFVIYICILYI